MRVTQPADDVERRAESLADLTAPRPEGGLRRRRSPLSAAPSAVGHVLVSPGRPLHTGERYAPPGIDVGTVRLHSGGSAGASARALGAAAYTVGDDIVVGDGYDPGSAAGRRLLAHELAHVAQQRSSPGPPTVHRQGQEEQPANRYGLTHVFGTFQYRLDPGLAAGIPGVLPPLQTLTPRPSATAPSTGSTGTTASPAPTPAPTPTPATPAPDSSEATPAEASPQEVGATPYGSSLVSTSGINPAGTWTLSVGGAGPPTVAGPTVTTSPTDYLQLQASAPGVWNPEGSAPGTSRGANVQAQVSPSQPFRVNPSLVAGFGYASGQRPSSAPDTLTPNAFATLIGELLVGGQDAAHSRFSAAANVSVIRTPYLNGVLTDVSGVSVGGALTVFSSYYHDAPAASPTDRPVGITQTPRLTVGVAGSYAAYQGRSAADPTRAGALRTYGVDVFATYVGPLTTVAGSTGRFFVTVTPGLRGAEGEGGSSVGFSGGVTVGWLTGGSSPPSGGSVEHE